MKDIVQTVGKEQQEAKSTHIFKNDMEKILHKLHKNSSRDSYKIVKKREREREQFRVPGIIETTKNHVHQDKCCLMY